ncbi:MAG: hypothetical protein V2B18_13175 [Pseudomonadota bacterium]
MKQSRIFPDRDVAIDYDVMNYVNYTVKTAIAEAVQDAVDRELLLMISGEGFTKRLDALIEARLHVLADQIVVRTSGAGPGRGHTGRTHRKISLSLPETLCARARELEGYFSCHVAAALELYLKLQKG